MCHLSLINLGLRTSGESYWRRYDGQEIKRDTLTSISLIFLFVK